MRKARKALRRRRRLLQARRKRAMQKRNQEGKVEDPTLNRAINQKNRPER